MSELEREFEKFIAEYDDVDEYECDCPGCS